jgi:hypothetical protein
MAPSCLQGLLKSTLFVVGASANFRIPDSNSSPAPDPDCDTSLEGAFPREILEEACGRIACTGPSPTHAETEIHPCTRANQQNLEDADLSMDRDAAIDLLNAIQEGRGDGRELLRLRQLLLGVRPGDSRRGDAMLQKRRTPDE